MEEPEKPAASNDEVGEKLLKAHQEALEAGDPSAMEAAALAFMAHACEEVSKNPDPDLLLKMEAHRLENAGRWHEAEAAYRQALVMAQTLDQPSREFKALDDLSGLYSFMRQPERARKAAEAALEAARRSGSSSLLNMALSSLTACFLVQKEFAQALTLNDELMREIGSEKMYDLSRGRGLVQRARCLVGLEQIALAEEYLQQAWPLLAPMSGVARFAGYQSGLAGWWSVMAQIRKSQRDFPGAADACRKAVEFRRTVSQAPQLGGPYKYAWLADSLETLGRSLLAVEDRVGAEAAFRESEAIRRAIQQPLGSD